MCNQDQHARLHVGSTLSDQLGRTIQQIKSTNEKVNLPVAVVRTRFVAAPRLYGICKSAMPLDATTAMTKQGNVIHTGVEFRWQLTNGR